MFMSYLIICIYDMHEELNALAVILDLKLNLFLKMYTVQACLFFKSTIQSNHLINLGDITAYELLSLLRNK